MHRQVTSANVEDYSSHIPGDDIALDREEDIVYKKGVLTHSEGVSTVKLMPQVGCQTINTLAAFPTSLYFLQDNSPNMENIEGDSLEAELGSRKKRNDLLSEFSEFMSDDIEDDQNNYNYDESEDNEFPDEYEGEGFTMAEEPTYDNTVDIDYFNASGTYTLDLIHQRRVLRHERSAAMNHLDLPEAMESTLMAHIDHSEFQLSSIHNKMVVAFYIVYTLRKYIVIHNIYLLCCCI